VHNYVRSSSFHAPCVCNPSSRLVAMILGANRSKTDFFNRRKNAGDFGNWCPRCSGTSILGHTRTAANLSCEITVAVQFQTQI
jgi:hypothetical protein